MLRSSKFTRNVFRSFSGQFVQVAPVSEHVSELILTRPEKLNALTLPMAKEIVFACSQLEQDTATRAIIVRGEGRAFCSGRDLTLSALHSDREAREYLETAVAAVLAVYRLPIPTVAALHGCALGFGLELALACDIRVSSHDCKLGFPETKLGIFPGAGGSFLLPLVLGSPSKALEWVLTGEQFTVADAVKSGLVSRSGDDATLEALAFANKIAANGPLGVRAAKRVLLKGIEAALDSCGWQEEAMRERQALTKTQDYHEALKAFAEKRAPVFTGK